MSRCEDGGGVLARAGAGELFGVAVVGGWETLRVQRGREGDGAGGGAGVQEDRGVDAAGWRDGDAGGGREIAVRAHEVGAVSPGGVVSRIVLATLNAKFIHAAFGLRYLFAN